MAFSYVPYTGNGSTTNYTLPFSYISKADIAVTVNGVAAPFTWISASILQITTAPVASSTVLIKRVTQKTAVPVNFTDGSTLLEGDLDTLSQYVLYVAQEQADYATDASGFAAAATTSATAAAGSATAAAGSATAAAGTATAATTSATAAAGSATAAATSAAAAASANSNASNLTVGTLPNGRFPAVLPAASGENLTSLNAAQLMGNVDAGRLTSVPAASLTGAIPGALPAVTQAAADGSTKVATTAYADTSASNSSYAVGFQGSTWKELGPSGTNTRLKATNYTNSSSRAIAVNVEITAISNGSRMKMTISSVVMVGPASQSGNNTGSLWIVPPGATYNIADAFGSNGVQSWQELRL